MVRHLFSSSFKCLSMSFSVVGTSSSVSIVTGLHDVDEYIQAQLLLAVRAPCWFEYVLNLLPV